jgi:hypothetical protein
MKPTLWNVLGADFALLGVVYAVSEKAAIQEVALWRCTGVVDGWAARPALPPVRVAPPVPESGYLDRDLRHRMLDSGWA